MARYSAVFVSQCRMSKNRDLASPNDRELNLLSKGLIESFWGALWLGIQPFLCFDVECPRVVIWAGPNDRIDTADKQ